MSHACRTPEAGWNDDQDRDPARVQAVRLSHGEVVRQVRRLRRVRLGGGAVGSRRRTRALARAAHRPGPALSGAPGEDGHRRTGPRARRGAGSRRGGVARRRSRDRKEHAAPLRAGSALGSKAARAVRQRRGVAAADPAARRAPRDALAGAPSRCRDRRKHGPRSRAQAPTLRARGGFDPDARPLRAGECGRLRDAGARSGPPARCVRKGDRHPGDPGRPRHQGRFHRRAARPRASGGHRAVFRGRSQPRLPDPARAQESIRVHERDRRLRDEVGGARRGAESFGVVPRRATHRRVGQRGGGGHERLAAAARRGAGAGRALVVGSRATCSPTRTST